MPPRRLPSGPERVPPRMPLIAPHHGRRRSFYHGPGRSCSPRLAARQPATERWSGGSLIRRPAQRPSQRARCERVGAAQRNPPSSEAAIEERWAPLRCAHPTFNDLRVARIGVGGRLRRSECHRCAVNPGGGGARGTHGGPIAAGGALPCPWVLLESPLLAARQRATERWSGGSHTSKLLAARRRAAERRGGGPHGPWERLVVSVSTG
jgi:hypothetical protein